MLTLLLLVTGCGSQPGAQLHPTQSPSYATSPSPSTETSPSPQTSPSLTHVFLIVMENRSYSQLIGDSYIAGLAAKYGVATNYHGVSHPSLPNYLALTSGSTWGIADDGYHALPAAGIGQQLTAAGITWRAYMEAMSNGCFGSAYPYALKHNPFAYYGGACPKQVVPFTSFQSDMTGTVPRFVWITPDLCNDGHDCSNSVAEGWLAKTVPEILATPAWTDGGVLFITWDEGEDSANSVLTLVIHPRPIFHSSSVAYNHYSLLATIEDELGLKRLGAAAQASAMTDLMEAVPQIP